MGLRTRNKVSANFSMSSMTDIVFLLLIFFMLTSTLVTTNALDILLPNSKVAKAKAKPTLSVTINKDLKYYIDKQRVEREFLESSLLSRFGSEDEKTVILRVEQGVPIEHAVYVMDIANQNRIKLVLATQPKK